MDRRNFLSLALGLVSLHVADLSSKSEVESVHQLAASDIYLVGKKKIIQLPKNPKDGDFVHIIIDVNGVTKACEMKSDYKILGDSAPLHLDSIANIKLTFDAAKKDWKIC
jgi:hypothetical protein